jgi:hypothetical protein
VEKAPTDYGDERKTAVVYTDGACSLNGKSDALAGIGERQCCISYRHQSNPSIKVSGGIQETNGRLIVLK